ncbi:MAG: hypothetical protein IJQ81_07265 [Oscillibacter sp.]|nr:hypothetical protein [Oscillibacter sp.]
MTRYPNLLAEIVALQTPFFDIPLEKFADAANVSYPVFAAVIEDGETLTLEEMRGMQKLIASHECAAHSAGCYDALSLDYLCSPALSCIDMRTNKGKFLRWKFTQTKEEAFSCAYGFLSEGEKFRVEVERISFDNNDACFIYAGFRQAMNGLKSAIWKADSLRRIVEAIESDRKRKRQRPARRERRFEREVTV